MFLLAFLNLYERKKEMKVKKKEISKKLSDFSFPASKKTPKESKTREMCPRNDFENKKKYYFNRI